jgi:hypothetical protein
MRPLLLCFVALLFSVDCLTLPDQKTSLVGLYNATGGPFWTNQWDVLTDPCDPGLKWFGVSCDSSGQKVVALDLYFNNLTGSLTDLQLPDLVTL